MKKKKTSHAPKVPLNLRDYEARKRQLLKEGLSPNELEKRIKAAAAYCGV